MGEPGKAKMGTAVARGPDGASPAAGLALPAAAPQQHNDDTPKTPSVWRTSCTHTAVRVDALVSNGTDEIEIPAFLHKPAD